MDLNDESGGSTVIEYEWKKMELRSLLIPSMRCNGSAVIIDGNIWLVGGRGVGQFNEVWCFNVSERMWEQISYTGEAPSPRDGHSATKVSNSSILIFGGQGVCKVSENNKLERFSGNLENIKIKAFAQREVYNDIYILDCASYAWQSLVRKSHCPTGRRGHSAIFLPPEPVMNKRHKTKVSFPTVDNILEFNTKGLVIIFGGACIEAGWGIEQVLNELWIYNIDTGLWTHQRSRGNHPPPMYEHSATLVSDQMIVIGGIVAPHKMPFLDNDDNNARESNSGRYNQLSTDNYLNSEVLILNLKNWTWSSLEVNLPYNRPSTLCIHGHSTILDAQSENTLIIFGGREIGNWRASLQGKQDMTRLKKPRGEERQGFLLNLVDCTVTPLKTVNRYPEARYGHIGVSTITPLVCNTPALRKKSEMTDSAEPGGARRHFNQRAGAGGTMSSSGAGNAFAQTKRSKVESSERTVQQEEEVMYIFGGSKATRGGFCTPDIYILVKRKVFEPYENAASSNGVILRAESCLNDDVATVASSQSQDLSFFKRSMMHKSSNDLVNAKLESAMVQPRLPTSYDDFKKNLLVSKSVRIFTNDQYSSNSNLNPMDLVSRAAGKRPGTASSHASVRSGRSGRPLSSNSKAAISRKTKKYVAPNADKLSMELPPIIQGLTLTEAKSEFHRLFPSPTRNSLSIADLSSGSMAMAMTSLQALSRGGSLLRTGSGGTHPPATAPAAATGGLGGVSSSHSFRPKTT